MAYIVRTVVDGYNDLMTNKSDPRVNDWFMMSSPFPTIIISLSYAYFVKNLGPRLMANRKPYDLKGTIMIYNIFQVILSVYLFNEALSSGWAGDYSLHCQPVDYSDNPKALRMARGCWMYYMSKFVELADTIFFVLRKKNNQVTTLHVIHHGIMPVSVWFGVKFTPGGHSTFFGLLNTFVHIWMYLYYFLAALGPAIQPYLWWKKYLTSMQILQFVLVMIHSFQLLILNCNYPTAFTWIIGLHAVLFFFLFRDFYKQSYSKKNPVEGKKYDVMSKVEPEREGIKQSDLWTSKFEQTGRKRRETGSEQSAIYADDYKVATGYISDEGMRNRVFIDKNRSVDES